ncbi:zf-DHHC-domain-containing protein [Cristinia sonorae]|uniref:Palmitoyltransferase n=1 Tax=Cristinia sonorae TaxID=1940300 RepID=A0A8K0UDX6_9AGAR|nr:zf-DHHC-domain-containing protein [Cristinia sonorae]
MAAKDHGHGRKTHGGADASCCGVIEESAARSRARREKRMEKPHPWVLLKLTVVVTLGIMGYAAYVYVGRFCIPMIRDNDGAIPGGRRTGIAFVVIFALLGLMMLWTYGMAVFISPGKAKDFSEKCEPPPFRAPIQRWYDSTSEINTGPFIPIPAEEAAQYQGNYDHSNQNSTIPSAPSIDLSDNTQTQVRSDTNVGVTDALPPVQAAKASHEVNQPQADEYQSAPNGAPMMFTRRPSTTPVLLPEYRYCSKCKFVKPLRTHHCRACGTCILKYDHHCPWIGQCVGAHNHKFFIHFLQWAILFCLWTLSTLVANIVKSGQFPRDDIDPQQIAIVALSGLFLLFTVSLFGTHLRLILLNWTTVESLNAERMKERESKVLSRLHAWYQFGAKRRTRKDWDAEWGRIGFEGNLWWLGSARKNWEAVMGDRWYQWILPIGRTPGDGLTYPTNPRFDEEGRWRRRSEWPAELR